MADTIIPPPDPNATPKPTFEPAPVPQTASAPAPAAVTPAAAGVAAPSAVPTQPGTTAPGASDLANPTAAGNSPATQAKENINSLTTPAPLPPTPAQQAAAAASAGKAAADSSAAATAAGQKDAAASAAAAAKASASASTAAKPAPAAKTGNAAVLDVLAPVNDTVKKMLDGNDPIAAIQYNQILTGDGPKNQAMLSGLGMKLKQENLDGQGAGSALLAMMARDTKYGEDQLRANVSADSAKRLYDMNLHGFDKAIEINQAAETQKRTDLANALSSGQLGAAKDLFGQVYPGIPFDEAAAKAASPQATANFNSRMKLVDQFVTQGDATNAKVVFDQLANDMPEMFGFPNDPAAAKAAMAGVDFTSEAWQNNLKAQNDASTAARTAALQGDQSALSSSIDQLFAKMTPAAVEGIATSAAKSRSLDDINKILTASGMAPVASTDEATMLDKTSFAKAVKSYDLMQASKKDVVDGLLDTFAKADPAIAIDPNARQAAKAWLAMHAYGIATDPTSGAVTNFTLDDKATPPWDPSSPQAYMFMDWPVATFNPDGSVAQRAYAGMTPYSDTYKPGDLTTAKGKEDTRLDKAYEQYVFSTNPDDRLDMNKWYFATQGGTKDPNPSLLTGSLAKPKDTTPVDPMVASKAVSDKIAKGEPLTAADINTAKTENLIPSQSLQTFVSDLNAGSGGANAYLRTHPDGNVLLDGKLVKLISDTKYGFNGTTLMEYNGKKYRLIDNGNWTDEAGHNVTNPLVG